MFATARYGLGEIKLPGQCFTCKQRSTSESSIRHQGSHLYLDNPPMQNYRSKSETAIIVAGCLKYRRFQFFSLFQFQFSHFGFLFFRRFRFFRCFVGVFRNFNTGKHVQRQTNTKLAHRQKKHLASNNSWKGNKFTYIGRCFVAEMLQWEWPLLANPNLHLLTVATPKTKSSLLHDFVAKIASTSMPTFLVHPIPRRHRVHVCNGKVQIGWN